MNERLIPLQFPGIVLLPFLESFMSVLRLQSVGTFCVIQIFRNKDSHIDMHGAIDAFINSAVIRSSPGALPFFNFFVAVSNSSRVGGSVLMSSLRKAIEGISRSSSGGGLFRSFSKWLAHVSSIADRSVMRTPSEFLTGPS